MVAQIRPKTYNKYISDVTAVASVALIENVDQTLLNHFIGIRWYSDAAGTTVVIPTAGLVTLEVFDDVTEQWTLATEDPLEAGTNTDKVSYEANLTSVRATVDADIDVATFYRLILVSNLEASTQSKAMSSSFETSSRGTTALGVFVQDQTTQPIDVWFTEDKGTATSLLPVTQGDYFVTWEPGHSIVVGDVIEARTAENYVQTEVIGQVGDVSEVNIPFSRDFPIGVTVNVGNPNLNVVGSTGTNRLFRVAPSTLQVVDITRVIAAIEDATAMDFTTFGSIAALTTGCVLRFLNGDGTYTNLFNWRTNGEFIERAFDHTLQSKVGGGSHGFVGRTTWGGQDKRGVTIRLDGALGEELEILVQDDLSTLDKFKAVAQGHVVQQ